MVGRGRAQEGHSRAGLAARAAMWRRSHRCRENITPKVDDQQIGLSSAAVEDQLVANRHGEPGGLAAPCPSASIGAEMSAAHAAGRGGCMRKTPALCVRNRSRRQHLLAGHGAAKASNAPHARQ